MIFLVTCIFFLSLIQPLLSAECLPNKRNPCIASCNGTHFDISKLFEYPINITSTYYTFQWSPCEGLKCYSDSTSDEKSAVCQGLGQGVNCGLYERPVFILQQTDPLMFTIEYPGGVSWRISVFKFIENKAHPETTVTFTKEYPMLQYNFVVSGKCIGQEDCKP